VSFGKTFKKLYAVFVSLKKTATEATESICEIYSDILDKRKCQRWFKKFRTGNFDLKDESEVDGAV
jgi:hypothetical protein